MPKFEKKYVHFTWSDELKGKFVIDAQSIPELREKVQEGATLQPVEYSDDEEYPFWIENDYTTRFVYYDPDYEEKVKFENVYKITFKDLHYWLAQGKGRYKVQDTIKSDLNYHVSFEDEPISSSILVCKWGDTEWVRPTREYMGID